MKTLIASLLVLASLPVMAQEKDCACKEAPKLAAKTATGKSAQAQLLALTKGKPAVLVFLTAGCPHNPKGTADMNRLAKLLGPKVPVVGITNLDPKLVPTYAKKLRAEFPILPDPSAKAILGYGATHSLDIALLCDDGRVPKLWNGYDQGVLKQLLQEVAKHHGPVVKANLTAFPAERQSGCGFPQP